LPLNACHVVAMGCSGLRTNDTTPPGGQGPGWVAGLIVVDRQRPDDPDKPAPDREGLDSE
jgi:hypothetical protein